MTVGCSELLCTCLPLRRTTRNFLESIRTRECLNAFIDPCLSIKIVPVRVVIHAIICFAPLRMTGVIRWMHGKMTPRCRMSVLSNNMAAFLIDFFHYDTWLVKVEVCNRNFFLFD